MASNAIALLARGMRSEFTETYQRYVKEASPHLQDVMTLGVPSDKLSELFGYWESAPHFLPWRRGEEIAAANMNSRSYVVDARDYGVAIEVHENDMNDDQTHSFLPRAKEAAMDGSIHPERVFFQMFLGATNNSLLPVVPVAPDGAAWFSTTDGGGANRFGFANGNIQATSGVASTGAVQQDFFGGYNRLLQFLDPFGLPLLPPGLVGQGIKVIFGVKNIQVFSQAFWQSYNAISVVGGAAAPSNPIAEAFAQLMKGGLQISLWPTPYITTDVWGLCATAIAPKGPLQTVRQPVRDNIEDMLNSDTARRTKIFRFQWDARWGYGLNAVYAWVGVQ